mmetsp:Transcript_63374/g.117873  ORF Transcript_63374/g.117873 Transcript_63374/m.117873 type:complete len:83 (+) Transcript_63374:404-652(+)
MPVAPTSTAVGSSGSDMTHVCSNSKQSFTARTAQLVGWEGKRCNTTALVAIAMLSLALFVQAARGAGLVHCVPWGMSLMGCP